MEEGSNPTMDGKPTITRQTPTARSTIDTAPNCVFCAYTTRYPAISPTSTSQDLDKHFDPEKLDPEGYVLLSTPHVMAFLDTQPLTRGHVLVTPRKHRVKIGDLGPDEAAEIGKVMPVLARAVIGAVMPDIPHDEADYNVVQNNGPGAAQVVNHVHFHIIPRPPLNYKAPTYPSKGKRKYDPAQIPQGFQATTILFGRGYRHYVDEDEPVEMVVEMRRRVAEEWKRAFGEDKEGGSKKRNERSPEKL